MENKTNDPPRTPSPVQGPGQLPPLPPTSREPPDPDPVEEDLPPGAESDFELPVSEQEPLRLPGEPLPDSTPTDEDDNPDDPRDDENEAAP